MSVYALVCAAALLLQARRGSELEMLPSLMWLALMGVPFVLQAGTLAPDAAARQGLGIALVGGALLVSDWASAARGSRRPLQASAAAPASTVYKVLALLFLAGALAHLVVLEEIPLVAKLTGAEADSRALALLREQTSKLLPAHEAVKYLLNWLLIIVGPLAMAGLLAARRYGLAIGFFALATVYAAMSLAKFPMVIFALPIVVLWLARLEPRLRRRVYTVGAGVLLLLVADAFRYFASTEHSVFRYRAPQATVAGLGLPAGDPRSTFSIADHVRMRPRALENDLSVRERLYDYLAYRIVLTPVDVAHRWYQYYPAVAGAFAGLQGLTPATREDSAQLPAAVVANWAYTERFPDRYLKSARAHASVDADAHARFGMAGLLVVAVAVLVLRLALQWLRTPSFESEMLYLVALTEFALLLPIASLQAILVANGLLVLVLLMLLIKAVPSWRELAAGIRAAGPRG